MRKWLSAAGLRLRKRNEVMKVLQQTVEKASHWIWIKREDESWVEG